MTILARCLSADKSDGWARDEAGVFYDEVVVVAIICCRSAMSSIRDGSLCDAEADARDLCAARGSIDKDRGRRGGRDRDGSVWSGNRMVEEEQFIDQT